MFSLLTRKMSTWSPVLLFLFHHLVFRQEVLNSSYMCVCVCIYVPCFQIYYTFVT